MNPQDQLRIKTYQAERRISYDDAAYERERELCKRERAAANGNGSVAPERFCWCDECVIRGKRYPILPHHDCKYTQARTALVSKAAQIATKRCGDPVGDKAGAYRWTAEFVKTMDRLSAPLLNQSESGGSERKAA